LGATDLFGTRKRSAKSNLVSLDVEADPLMEIQKAGQSSAPQNDKELILLI
jgi:hypothetical protein